MQAFISDMISQMDDDLNDWFPTKIVREYVGETITRYLSKRDDPEFVEFSLQTFAAGDVAGIKARMVSASRRP